jgi:hypothetical protein
VALGEAVWDGRESWPVGWGAALLYGVTGEDAFRATAERVADGMCETPELPEDARSLLLEMADIVEARAALPDDAPSE